MTTAARPPTSRLDPYISSWGRVGEMVVTIWPVLLAKAQAPPKYKGTQKVPQTKVWQGYTDGLSQAALDKILTARIGVPNVTPVRIYSVTGATWSEDFDRTSLSVTVTFHDPYGRIAKYTEPGSWMYLALPLGASVWEIGLFYIWERTVGDARKHEVSVTGFDIASRLDHVGPEDRIYRKRSANDIARFLCSHYKLALKQERTVRKIPYLKLDGRSPYEQIVEAYAHDTHYEGSEWRIRAVGQTLWIYRLHADALMEPSQPKGALLEINTNDANSEVEAVQGNMISGSLRESLEGKRTQIVVNGVRRATANQMIAQFPFVVLQSKDISKYGPLVERVKLEDSVGTGGGTDAMKLARENMRVHGDLTRVATYEVPGHPLLRAGHHIYINDPKGTGITKWLIVSRITHTVSGSTYRMKVDVSPYPKTQKVDVLRYENPEAGRVASQAGGGMSEWGAGSTSPPDAPWGLGGIGSLLPGTGTASAPWGLSTVGGWPGNDASCFDEGQVARGQGSRCRAAPGAARDGRAGRVVDARPHYGDRDSVGLFQMRTSIWNNGKYNGYPGNPEIQMGWFIDQALAQQRKNGFRTNDTSRYGKWCQAIEISAYPDRYQRRYSEARGYLG